LGRGSTPEKPGGGRRENKKEGGRGGEGEQLKSEKNLNEERVSFTGD